MTFILHLDTEKRSDIASRIGILRQYTSGRGIPRTFEYSCHYQVLRALHCFFGTAIEIERVTDAYMRPWKYS
jgi:hypothetical protein